MQNDMNIQAPWIGMCGEDWNRRCKQFNEDEEDIDDGREEDNDENA